MPPAKKVKKPESVTFTTPTGRLINSSLFEKDIYVDERTGKEGGPKYKIEVAFNPDDVQGEKTIEDMILDAACEVWGDAAEDEYLDGKIKFFIDGDIIAKGREDKGKQGDAYKGKLVLRADTMFNKDGVDGPGGIQVFAPDLSPIDFASQGEIYPGCMVQINISLDPYISSFGGFKAIKAYLNGVQKVGEGERLIAKKDMAGAFKPVGRAAGAATGGRRSRAG